MEIIELTEDELKELEERLHCYDLNPELFTTLPRMWLKAT